jgi:hypothetical protein
MLPPLQPTFTRRTSGYCLGTTVVVEPFISFPVKCSLSHYSALFSVSSSADSNG